MQPAKNTTTAHTYIHQTSASRMLLAFFVLSGFMLFQPAASAQLMIENTPFLQQENQFFESRTNESIPNEYIPTPDENISNNGILNENTPTENIPNVNMPPTVKKVQAPVKPDAPFPVQYKVVDGKLVCSKKNDHPRKST